MSMLRRAVFVELLLFALIIRNDAACWMGLLKKDGTHCQDSVDRTWHAVGSAWTNSRCDKCECATHCQDILDKTWHPGGSSWTNSRCDQCDCSADGINCCDGASLSIEHLTQPSIYVQEWTSAITETAPFCASQCLVY
ncbi:hypothetical protein MHYP_G00353890 [Metynnis hypsauchen]